jgi:hypothetical protein
MAMDKDFVFLDWGLSHANNPILISLSDKSLYFNIIKFSDTFLLTSSPKMLHVLYAKWISELCPYSNKNLNELMRDAERFIETKLNGKILKNLNCYA